MSFLSATFLFGLAALSAPIVLHLINRQRYPRLPFTTLRFFSVSEKRNRLQNRLVDRFILFLRLLALAALACGLARPFGGFGIGEKRLAVVVVLDNSASMSRVEGGETVFESARRAALALLDDLAVTDRVAVLTTAAADPTPLPAGEPAATALAARVGVPTALIPTTAADWSVAAVPQLTTDTDMLEAALARLPAAVPVMLAGFATPASPVLEQSHEQLRRWLETVQPAATAGNPPAALGQAAQLLSATGDGDRLAVLIGDLQASDWLAGPASELSGLDLLAVDCAGQAETANLGIELGELYQREVDLGQSASAAVQIRNYGRQASTSSRLQVIYGDAGQSQVLAIPSLQPGASVRIGFAIPANGSARSLPACATIVAADDMFEGDNSWYFQIGIRPQARVLCISGAPAETAAGRQDFFIVNALAPSGASGASSSGIEAQARDLEALRELALFQYNVIILAGVERLDTELVARLDRFVADGGGLMIFPGPRTSPEDSNAWPFMPAELGARQDDTFVFVDTVDTESTLMAEIARRSGNDLTTLTTTRWFPLQPRSTARVLARFSNGQPALVSGGDGGRVVLAAAGAHSDFSDWPLRPAFVLLLRGLVRDLATPKTALTVVPERRVGQGSSRWIDDALAAGTPATFRVSLHGSGLSWQPLPWYRAGQILTLPAAATPGHYLLSVQPGQAKAVPSRPGVGSDDLLVCVNHDPRESQGERLTQTALQDRLPGAMVTVKTAGDLSGDTLSTWRTGSELWRILLVLAFLLLVSEGLVAWRSHGNE